MLERKVLSRFPRCLFDSLMKTLMQVDVVQNLCLIRGEQRTRDLEYAGVVIAGSILQYFELRGNLNDCHE